MFNSTLPIFFPISFSKPETIWGYGLTAVSAIDISEIVFFLSSYIRTAVPAKGKSIDPLILDFLYRDF